MVTYWAAAVSTHLTGSPSHAARVVAEVFFALAAVGFALVLTVMFFNWPKFVVPPPQRGEAGAVAEWHKKDGNTGRG